MYADVELIGDICKQLAKENIYSISLCEVEGGSFPIAPVACIYLLDFQDGTDKRCLSVPSVV